MPVTVSIFLTIPIRNPTGKGTSFAIFIFGPAFTPPDSSPDRGTQFHCDLQPIRSSIRNLGARRYGAHGWAQNWAQW
jgi:hypothetical protein